MGWWKETNGNTDTWYRVRWTNEWYGDWEFNGRIGVREKWVWEYAHEVNECLRGAD